VRRSRACADRRLLHTDGVDHPYGFGRIAGANALSDVGAGPLSVLNLVALPPNQLGIEVVGEILRGGEDVVTAAGG
jgi:selenide,water dikinase